MPPKRSSDAKNSNLEIGKDRVLAHFRYEGATTVPSSPLPHAPSTPQFEFDPDPENTPVDWDPVLGRRRDSDSTPSMPSTANSETVHYKYSCIICGASATFIRKAESQHIQRLRRHLLEQHAQLIQLEESVTVEGQRLLVPFRKRRREEVIDVDDDAIMVTMQDMYTGFSEEDLFLVMFAKNHIPFRLIECPLFRLSIKPSLAAIFTNRHQLPQKTAELVERDRAAWFTSARRQTVSLSFDLGTVFAHYCIVMVGHNNHHRFWRCFRMGEGSNWAEQVAGFVLTVIKEMHDHEIKVLSVCADNASVMNSAISKVLQQHPFILQVHCAAHVVQLLVNDVHLDRSDSPHERVASALKQLRVGALKSFNIPEAVDTRWNSVYDQMMAFLKIWPDMVGVPVVTATFVSMVEKASQALRPFYEATQIVQSDYADVFSYLDAVSILQDAATRDEVVEKQCEPGRQPQVYIEIQKTKQRVLFNPQMMSWEEPPI